MANIELIEIQRDGTVADQHGGISEAATEVCDSMAALYTVAGFVPPWTGYLVLRGREVVGMGGFKHPPRDGAVEIAYTTFAPFERQGIATAIATELVQIARKTESEVRIRACTLPEDGASPAILRKAGFAHLGMVTDPDDGLVWLWEWQA